MFLYLSSMCNPIIYAFRSPAFREGYKEILCQTPNYVISDGELLLVSWLYVIYACMYMMELSNVPSFPSG